MASGSKAWSALSLGAALGSAAVAKKALNGGWKAATGKNPPANPADPDIDLWEAVMWAAVSGTAVAIVKMLATRKAANYFAKSTGTCRPGSRPTASRRARAAPTPVTSWLRASTTRSSAHARAATLRGLRLFVLFAHPARGRSPCRGPRSGLPSRCCVLTCADHAPGASCLTRSPCRSASSHRRAGSGGEPGSSSCR